MLPYSKVTHEELMTMPITLLEKSVYPDSPTEEKEIQKILDQRRQEVHVQGDVYRNDAIAANIETPEQEAEWQKKIDERVAKIQKVPITQAIGTEVTVDPETLPQTEPTEPVEPSLPPTPETTSAKTRWCEFCDSKGGRHKLSCTRPREEKV